MPEGPTPQEKMAAMQFQEGRRHFMEMHYFDAIQCLRESVRLAPHKGQYHKLLAQALLKNPHWRKEAEEHFHEALKTNQFDAECFAGLGEIYDGEGMKSRAIKMFQQALNYDPSNEFAQEKLDAHKPQGTMQGLKGMLRRKKDKGEKEEKVSEK